MTSGGLVSLALLAAVVTVFSSPSTVSAHARLVESSPAVGEVLQAAPATVTITFSNDIQKITGTYGIDVVGADGMDATAGEATLDDNNRSVLGVPLQPNLSAGRYVVTYKNVSDADGDAFDGGFAFYVGVEPTAEELAEDALLEPAKADATPTIVAGSPATSESPSPTVIDEPASATPSDADREGTGSDNGSDLNIRLIIAGAAIVLAVVGGGVWLAVRRG